MKYIENLSFAYENNNTIFDYRARFLYDNISLYIVPMVNPDGVDLVVGNIEKYLPNIFNNAKILSDNYPNIPFPDGWKANINGESLINFHHFIFKKQCSLYYISIFFASNVILPFQHSRFSLFQ